MPNYENERNTTSQQRNTSSAFATPDESRLEQVMEITKS